MTKRELERRIEELEGKVDDLQRLAQNADLILAAMVGRLAHETDGHFDIGVPDSVIGTDEDRWLMAVIHGFNRASEGQG
ncbi:hypothetical protein [Hasllibacter sp. MH4015]|uniref:hypothetical protein n=1 Tax=Hasllibacter sp. MH4015 TaxID=2854029 RepID=UPI001CD68983|nr:hypothetical protein [Hasllibacter sp. MH4015]